MIIKSSHLVWECVESDWPNARFDHRPGSTAALLTVFLARQGALQYGIAVELRLRLLRPSHIRMMPGKRAKWNYDPARAFAPGDAGTPVGGRNDLSVLPDCSGTGD